MRFRVELVKGCCQLHTFNVKDSRRAIVGDEVYAWLGHLEAHLHSDKWREKFVNIREAVDEQWRSQCNPSVCSPEEINLDNVGI